MTLNHLSDDELISSLHALSVDARRLDARVIVHLFEVAGGAAAGPNRAAF